MTSRSPIPSQRRVVYLNDETPQKDPTTIFHSPYTNGKRSKEYTNPTLISSSVFYEYKANNVDYKSGQLDHFGRSKSPYTNQPDNFIGNDERSNTPGRSVTPDRSKTPRRKRQFDQTKDYIRDHLSTGLTVTAEKKRPMKRYINSIPNLEQFQQNANQAETVKFYLGQVQDRSLKKSASHINIDQVSQISGGGQGVQNNVSGLGQSEHGSTPLRRNNSFILSKKKEEEEYNSQNLPFSIRKDNNEQQYPQTPIRNKEQPYNIISGIGYESRNMTPNTMQRYLNDQQLYQQTTPSKKGDTMSNHSNGGAQEHRSMTPTTLQKYKQSFTPLKECCDQCINQKMMQNKQQKEKERREKDYIEQQQINQKMSEEIARQKHLSKEKQISVRKQYDQYIKVKTEEDKIKKIEQIQENIQYNERMNKLIEQEKQIELERAKQQKIQKIKMYSQQLKDQIQQKEVQRKHQMTKERLDNERNQQIINKVQQERQQIQFKNTPNMVEYREQLLNQQIQHDLIKNKEKKEEQQMYKKIQEQVSKYSEQEKELLRQIKQKKKQDYENFMKQKETYSHQKQDEKKKIDQETRQRFQDIENEDHLKRLNSKRIQTLQKQNFCNILKEQIQQKEVEQDIRKKEDLKKSVSTTLLMNPSYSKIPINGLSPCNTCHKKVHKYQLALYD